jgi:uncharacterized membrane protein
LLSTALCLVVSSYPPIYCSVFLGTLGLLAEVVAEAESVEVEVEDYRHQSA